MIEKDEFCIYFTLIYLIFCYVFINILWAFTCDFYIVGDIEQKDRREEETGPKRSIMSILEACHSMKNHVAACQSSLKFQSATVAWLKHAAA